MWINPSEFLFITLGGMVFVHELIDIYLMVLYQYSDNYGRINRGEINEG